VFQAYIKQQPFFRESKEAVDTMRIELDKMRKTLKFNRVKSFYLSEWNGCHFVSFDM